MTLAPSPRPVDQPGSVDPPGHALAPLLLPDALRLTVEQFEAATSLDAGALFPGLQIDLLEIWQG